MIELTAVLDGQLKVVLKAATTFLLLTARRWYLAV